MFHDAFANLEGQIQSGKCKVALLKTFHDVQRVKIVIESRAVIAHQLIQPVFAGMSEWRMADVVNQRQRFGQIGIQIQRARNCARDLRNF